MKKKRNRLRLAKIALTVLLLTFAVFSGVIYFSDVELNYDFYSDESGLAAGRISIEADFDGKYSLYWGDDEGNRLTRDMDGFTASFSEFLEVEVTDGKGEGEVIDFTAIPDGAATVLVYCSGIKCGEAPIPEENLPSEEELVYTFGVLSDVHFNRYKALFCDVAKLTFPNALNFFDRLDVSLVALSGDISNSGEAESFISFGEIASEYDFPVFTVTGNHDVNDEFTKENWNKYVNRGAYGDSKLTGILSVADNGMDFVYSVPQSGDVFIFFNQIVWEYGDKENDRLVTDEQLDWLENQLKEHTDERVYLFFHTFTADNEGNTYDFCGNLVNSQGVYYELVYTVGAADEVRFRELLTNNSNVLFFSGHSHWGFDMQKFNPQLNVASYGDGGATGIHVPSVTSPRWVTDRSEEIESRTLRSSEGYYVEVYEDRTVLYGVDFFKGEFLSYATYQTEE